MAQPIAIEWPGPGGSNPTQIAFTAGAMTELRWRQQRSKREQGEAKNDPTNRGRMTRAGRERGEGKNHQTERQNIVCCSHAP